jgi:3-oxoacyl-[acyl-carrier protein] reductase
MRIKDKVAIVTGSARGIGKYIALRLAKEGAKVVVTDINLEGCMAVVESFENFGGSGMAIKCDVTKSEEVESLINKTVEAYGKLDILVNNAGITMDATLKKMTEDQWDKVLDVNLKSVFLCSKYASGMMAENGGGRIINISSLSGVEGNFGQANYSASKAGIIGITKTLSKELGRKNITVNVVAPGFINTEMTQKIPEKVVEKLLATIPVGRKGEPEEVAAAVLYLATDEAGFVNGVTLNINGGSYVI